ncbi:MAG: hypothetical protein AAGE18_02925 [Pseudomonadota bacterium]
MFKQVLATLAVGTLLSVSAGTAGAQTDTFSRGAAQFLNGAIQGDVFVEERRTHLADREPIDIRRSRAPSGISFGRRLTDDGEGGGPIVFSATEGRILFSPGSRGFRHRGFRSRGFRRGGFRSRGGFRRGFRRGGFRSRGFRGRRINHGGFRKGFFFHY